MSRLAILGGGLAGASVAWFLRDRRPLVLEQAERPGRGASAHNAGMQRRLVVDPIERALAVRSGEWLQRLPPGFEATALRKTGGVVATLAPSSALAAAAADLVKRGVACAPLSPHDRPRLCAEVPLGDAWRVADEHLIDASTLLDGFLGGAVRAGGRVASARPGRLEVRSGRLVGVTTPEGTLPCDVAVVATGAWAGIAARDLGRQSPVTPLARHLFQLGPDPAARPEEPWVWLDDAGLYGRPESGGWLVSPCDETAELPPPDGAVRGGAATAEGFALLEARLRRLAPALADLPVRAAWTGLRSFSADRRPVVGPDPEIEGLYWAVGLGGAGVTTCFAIGELLAARMDGNAVPWLDIAALDPSRWDFTHS